MTCDRGLVIVWDELWGQCLLELGVFDRRLRRGRLLDGRRGMSPDRGDGMRSEAGGRERRV